MEKKAKCGCVFEVKNGHYDDERIVVCAKHGKRL